ncbi:cell wall-active antibiotics response protein LiaF [Gracilibacillus alcaliphilus]|uniref:cell wall-active antibiotics response protein LiaF n=1 Tax=Gracilibacillus alcaliphilus TaxID=1401441 RepID=UPI00195BA67A|nr:cell wall-active antibiotics response protein LiaF [Gracilibacillus alcaliphilus]MBM7677296.1 lia operon protein LiaF [Gracilibacillus alcaliphilus]
MFKKGNHDLLQLLLIIGAVFLLLEIIFMDPGLLFLIALGAVGIYLGRKSFHTITGKTIFWGGAFFIFIAVLNTFILRIVIGAAVVYLIWHWYQQRQQETEQKPKYVNAADEVPYEDHVIQNKWFGKYHTTDEGFIWQDLNFQSAVGDVVIDLNDTMLPPEEAVIIIRQLAGKVTIIVPYDVEIILDHTVVFGDIHVFDHSEANAFNRHIQLQTKDYYASDQRVKIFTQMIAGKLEVKRG